MKLGNLLIVDDEELLVKNISFILKEYAETIHVAFNGFQAFEILKAQDIQCVICDISMPKMTGMELIKNVRESGMEVPFIFYTAYGQDELMMEAAKYGAFDFLRKPDFEALEEVVARGIEEGFKRQNKGINDQSLLSEYESILLELKHL